MDDQSSNKWRRLLPVTAAILLFALLLFAAMTAPALAQTGDGEDGEAPFAANVVTTTTTANVNLRRQPGLMSEIIQVVPAGTIVGFTGFTDGTGNWAQVDPVGAPVGWMHTSLLASVPDGLQVRPADQPEEEAEVEFAGNVVTGQTQFNVYLRSTPNQSFNIIETLPAGTVVGYTGFTDDSGNWVQVDPVGAPVGWVWGEFLTNVPQDLQVRPADLPEEEAEEEMSFFPANVVTTTTTANVNLREGPGLDMTIIEVVSEGTIVGFTGFTDASRQWVQVDPVGAPVGWMHTSLLAFIPDGLQVADQTMENGG